MTDITQAGNKSFQLMHCLSCNANFKKNGISHKYQHRQCRTIPLSQHVQEQLGSVEPEKKEEIYYRNRCRGVCKELQVEGWKKGTMLCDYCGSDDYPLWLRIDEHETHCPCCGRWPKLSLGGSYNVD